MSFLLKSFWSKKKYSDSFSLKKRALNFDLVFDIFEYFEVFDPKYLKCLKNKIKKNLTKDIFSEIKRDHLNKKQELKEKQFLGFLDCFYCIFFAKIALVEGDIKKALYYMKMVYLKEQSFLFDYCRVNYKDCSYAKKSNFWKQKRESFKFSFLFNFIPNSPGKCFFVKKHLSILSAIKVERYFITTYCLFEQKDIINFFFSKEALEREILNLLLFNFKNYENKTQQQVFSILDKIEKTIEGKTKKWEEFFSEKILEKIKDKQKLILFLSYLEKGEIFSFLSEKTTGYLAKNTGEKIVFNLLDIESSYFSSVSKESSVNKMEFFETYNFFFESVFKNLSSSEEDRETSVFFEKTKIEFNKTCEEKDGIFIVLMNGLGSYLVKNQGSDLRMGEILFFLYFFLNHSKNVFLVVNDVLEEVHLLPIISRYENKTQKNISQEISDILANKRIIFNDFYQNVDLNTSIVEVIETVQEEISNSNLNRILENVKTIDSSQYFPDKIKLFKDYCFALYDLKKRILTEAGKNILSLEDLEELEISKDGKDKRKVFWRNFFSKILFPEIVIAIIFNFTDKKKSASSFYYFKSKVVKKSLSCLQEEGYFFKEKEVRETLFVLIMSGIINETTIRGVGTLKKREEGFEKCLSIKNGFNFAYLLRECSLNRYKSEPIQKTLREILS